MKHINESKSNSYKFVLESCQNICWNIKHNILQRYVYWEWIRHARVHNHMSFCRTWMYIWEFYIMIFFFLFTSQGIMQINKNLAIFLHQTISYDFTRESISVSSRVFVSMPLLLSHVNQPKPLKNSHCYHKTPWYSAN